MTMREQRVLIAGCGDVGTQLGTRLSARGAQVFGLRRTINQLPAGIHGIGADLTDPLTLERLPACDWVFYTAAAGGGDPEQYRRTYLEGLHHLLRALPHPPRHLFLTSSSRVYAQSEHDWVDEQSVTEPASEQARILLASERLALESGIPATVVRFSGIYGPSRQRFLEEVLEGRMNPQPPAPFSNRIHEVDAANAVAWLAQKALNGEDLEPLYVASDCEPVRLDEVVDWVRSQVPCKAPVEGARKGGRAGSKRCSNRKLLQSGFEFRYPDYRAGYREMISKL